MATQTKKRRSSQPKLDIELHDFNAYKRVQTEYEGVQVMTEALEYFKGEFQIGWRTRGNKLEIRGP